jgi:putative oxidoreductase
MSALLEPLLTYLPYLALLTRVWVGGNMMIHGYPKIKNPRQIAEMTKQHMGVPIGATHTVSVLEFFGGLFLIIGLIVPMVALFFAIFMLGNIIVKGRMHGAYIASGKLSYEIDAVYLLLSIILLVLGAGALSIDSLLGL